MRKSSNPNVNTKIQVPTNCVPYMCRLIKYFETENTIFLLLEYHAYGRLFQYLDNLSDIGLTFLEQLKQNPQNNEKPAQVNRRRSLQFKLNSSFANLETVAKRRSKSFRYNNNKTNQASPIDLQNFKQTLNVNANVQVNIKIGSSSSSSSDSLSKKTTTTTTPKFANLLSSSDSSSSNSDSTTLLKSAKPSVKQRISPLMFLSNSFKSLNRTSKSDIPDVLLTDSDLVETDFIKVTRKW